MLTCVGALRNLHDRREDKNILYNTL